MTPDQRIGTQLGSYRIDAVLGRGGMGVVYVAEHVHLGRKVAVKVLAPELAGDSDFRMRFEREWRVAASLDHPNVVPVYDAGEVDGTVFIAMRYIEGTDLRRVITAEGGLEPARVLAIIAQVASALDLAHGAGLVHRDVKPANILLTGGPERESAYLCDFGLAKRRDSASLTRTGMFVGTIDYCAPEQFRGEPLDARTDVYALGCVTYECLTGTVPFPREQEPAVMYAHLQDPPPSASPIRQGLPREVDDVVATAMAKDREERFGSCGELAAALRAAFGEAAIDTEAREAQTVVRPPARPTAREASPGGRRRRIRLAVVGLVLVGAVLAGTILVFGGSAGRIASASDRDGDLDIYVTDPEGSGLTRVTDVAADAVVDDDQDPAWSPDGGRLAFAGRPESYWEIFVINADGTGIVRLTDNDVDDMDPAWSPDGERIAFERFPAGEGDTEIFTMNADGTGVARLTRNDVNDQDPAWSPDGERIVFSSQSEDFNVDLMLIRPDGSDPVRVTGRDEQDDGDYLTPAWSPDGDRIAVASNRGDDVDYEIYVMMADGGGLTRVTDNEYDDVHPTWSPDGELLAFEGKPDGTADSEIFVGAIDGTGLRRLTRNDTQDTGPAWSS